MWHTFLTTCCFLVLILEMLNLTWQLVLFVSYSFFALCLFCCLHISEIAKHSGALLCNIHDNWCVVWFEKILKCVTDIDEILFFGVCIKIFEIFDEFALFNSLDGFKNIIVLLLPWSRWTCKYFWKIFVAICWSLLQSVTVKLMISYVLILMIIQYRSSRKIEDFTKDVNEDEDWSFPKLKSGQQNSNLSMLI